MNLNKALLLAQLGFLSACISAETTGDGRQDWCHGSLKGFLLLFRVQQTISFTELVSGGILDKNAILQIISGVVKGLGQKQNGFVYVFARLPNPF